MYSFDDNTLQHLTLHRQFDVTEYSYFDNLLGEDFQLLDSKNWAISNHESIVF